MTLAMPGRRAVAGISPDRRLALGLLVSALLHALVLSLQFGVVTLGGGDGAAPLTVRLTGVDKAPAPSPAPVTAPAPASAPAPAPTLVRVRVHVRIARNVLLRQRVVDRCMTISHRSPFNLR